ncbi:MAG: hypothetical protein RR248_02675 [Clostridia bacterium]
MKSVFNCLTAVCVIVGCVIGAGFASGKEVLIFFYQGNPLLVFISCFILFFVGTVLFLIASNRYKIYDTHILFYKIFGRLNIIFELLINLAYFIVLATMLAGSNLCLSKIFNTSSIFPFFSLATAILCGYALNHDISGLKFVNVLAVPLIIVFIIYICLQRGDASVVCEGQRLSSSLSYSAFNCIMMCGVLLPLGKGLNKKECVITSLISSLFLSALVALILQRINQGVFLDTPMPLISLAKERGIIPFYLASGALYLSIVTTLVSNAFPLVRSLGNVVKDKTVSTAIVMFCALIFSLVGFDNIIEKAYPAIAIFGLIVIIFLLVGLIFDYILEKKRSKERQNHDAVTN